MNISLSPILEQKIQEKIASGFYNSASEVVREALRLLFEQEEIQKNRIEELKKEIELGLEDIKNGYIIKGKDSYARIKEKSAQKRKIG